MSAMTEEKLTVVLTEIIQISFQICDNKTIEYRNACPHLVDSISREGSVQLVQRMLGQTYGEFSLNEHGSQLVWINYPDSFQMWIAEHTEDSLYPHAIAAIQKYLMEQGLAHAT